MKILEIPAVCVSLVAPHRTELSSPLSTADVKLLQNTHSCTTFIILHIVNVSTFTRPRVFVVNNKVKLGIFIVNWSLAKVNKYILEFALICYNKGHKSMYIFRPKAGEVSGSAVAQRSKETKDGGTASLPYGHFLCKCCCSSSLSFCWPGGHERAP